MSKKNDYVSEGLVTLRHKYVSEELNALTGDGDASAPSSGIDIDKSLSMQEQRTEMYHRVRDDLDICLHKELAKLATQIDLEKQDL